MSRSRIITGPNPAPRNTPAEGLFLPLDSGTLAFPTTSGSFVNLPTGGTTGFALGDVWWRPQGRPARPGDVVVLMPKFAVSTTATTNAPLFFAPVVRNRTNGAVVRFASLSSGALGVASWRVNAGTAIGAAEIQINAPVVHRVRADEIGPDGAVLFGLQYSVQHTAGTFSLIETMFFTSYGPGGLLVDGPYDLIPGTGIVFTGQSLANAVITGNISDLYPTKLIASLIDDGYEVGWWQTNFSGTRYDQRDVWNRLAGGAGTRYEKVLVIDDGGTADLLNSETAAGILAEIETESDQYKADFDTGVVDFVKVTVPHSTSYSGPQETVRGTLNGLIVANANAKFDAVVDLETYNADFGDATSDLFDPDEVHFDPAGHTEVAAAIKEAILPLLL